MSEPEQTAEAQQQEETTPEVVEEQTQQPEVESPESAEPVQEVQEQTNEQSTTEESEVQQPEVALPETKKPGKKKIDFRKEYFKSREKVRQLEDRFEDLERKFQESRQPDMVSEIQSKLNLEPEEAKKLDEVLRTYQATNSPAPKKDSEIDKLTKSFEEKSLMIMGDHEDWEEMAPTMQEIFIEKYEKNARAALSIDPEDYLNLARSRSHEKHNQSLLAQQKQQIGKANSKTLAGAESSRGGSSKPKTKKNWTRERISKLSPDQYVKHEKEIKAAMRRGEID